jgi:hypothetical protein
VQLQDVYDIPEEVREGPHSPAFTRFLQLFFGDWGSSGGYDSRLLISGKADLSFIGDLAPHEAEVAKKLLRRNLKLRYTHILQGVAAMGDLVAVPALRAMLADEPNLSRQLSIAGTLWKLVRDPSFVDCLNRMKTSQERFLKQAHLHQVLWLGDERAIDLLLDLLEDSDSIVRSLALRNLTALELGRRLMVPINQLPHSAAYYLERRHDRELRRLLVRNIPAVAF